MLRLTAPVPISGSLVLNPVRDVFWRVSSCTYALEQAVTRSVVARADSIRRNVLFGATLGPS